jgi:hypothetical protein
MLFVEVWSLDPGGWDNRGGRADFPHVLNLREAGICHNGLESLE